MNTTWAFGGVYELRKGSIDELQKNSEVIIITGKRGSGKTCLACYLLEKSDNAFFFGFPEEKKVYLPENILPLPFDNIESLPENATIFFDEAALWFYARDSMSRFNKLISQIITEARHHNQLIIFATHTLRKLDIGIVIDADAILFKEPSHLHVKFERAEIRYIMKEVAKEFEKIEGDRRKYSYMLSHDFEQLVETPLPSFWKEELSHITIQVQLDTEPISYKVEKKIPSEGGFSFIIDEFGNIYEESYNIAALKIRCLQLSKEKKGIIFRVYDNRGYPLYACSDGLILFNA